jgi:hypothetical protein
MIDPVVAEALGIERADAENLLNGFASPSVADALGVPLVNLQPYLDIGVVAVVFADRLGIPSEAVEDFMTRLTKKGRVGLLFGMLLAG